MSALSSASTQRVRRVVRLAVLGVLALALLFALRIAYSAYSQQRAVFFPSRRPVAVENQRTGLPGVRDVAFRAGAIELRGFYVPSRNRRAVILVHGAGGDRSSLLAEARMLSDRGYGVLSFDLPGHGESGGVIRWAEPERASVRAAVDWLDKSAELGPRGIGAFGFSLGGYVLVQVGAVEPRLSALVLSGTPSDPVEQVRYQHARYSFLSQSPALFVLERGGMDLAVRGVDFAGRIAPRPLLVIGGSDDHTVPASMAGALFRAAGEPKELHLIAGADHGSYRAKGGAEYEARLVAFFDRSLE
jgi:alpha-beta hydrolase superfamily lysophospholipase